MSSVKTLVFTSNQATAQANVLTMKFDTFPITIPRDCECALSKAFINYSWPNCPSGGGFSYSYIHNAVTYGPYNLVGNFTVPELNGTIQFQMQQNGHYLLDSTGTTQYFASVYEDAIRYGVGILMAPVSLGTGWTNPASMVITNTTMQIIFSAPLSSMLGYSNAQYTFPATPQATSQQTTSPNIPQLSPFPAISINTSIVSNPETNFSTPSSIWTFSPAVSYGSQVSIIPTNLEFVPAIPGVYTQISVSLTSILGQPVNIIDPAWTVTLLLRDKSNNL